MARYYKNGKTVFDADDMKALSRDADEPLTDGQASFLALVAGAPDPVRHPEEFRAWQVSHSTTESKEIEQ